MRRTTDSFKSENKIDTVACYITYPDGAPRGIIQIIHGMCEYYGRYSELEEYLVKNGYIVCGNDHVGHGKSAPDDASLGVFGDRDGDRTVIADVGTLHDMMRKKYRALPYIIIGHSFGSFVARAYVATHKDAADALVLSGTAGQKMPVRSGMALCSLISVFKGRKYRSALVKRLGFAGYNKRIPDAVTGTEWVTTDREALKEYNADRLCTFTFSVGAYYDMFRLISYVQSEAWYNAFPKALPVFIITGENDPIGGYTKGIYEMMEKLNDRYVSDVEFKIYKNERHELFTGLSRREAMHDVAEWIDEKVAEIHESRTQRTENI